MTNKHLDQMVNALVNQKPDEAKEHLKQYFGDTAAKIINPPEEVEEIVPPTEE